MLSCSLAFGGRTLTTTLILHPWDIVDDVPEAGRNILVTLPEILLFTDPPCRGVMGMFLFLTIVESFCSLGTNIKPMIATSITFLLYK